MMKTNEQSKHKLRNRHRTPGYLLICAVLIMLAVVIFIPFWNSIVISFMPSSQVTLHPAAMLPYGFTLDNYENLIVRGGLLTAYGNTILLAAGGTVYGMVISTMMAYAFSQRFPGRRLLFVMMVITMYFSGGVIPMYLHIKDMGMLNKLSTVLLMGGVSAYNIILMKNGFENTPQSLVEAAKIDGANDFTIFLKVMLPLQKPLLATFSLFTFVGYWNTWYWPMLILRDADQIPLMLYLRNIINQMQESLMYSGSAMQYSEGVFPMGVRMAAVVLTMLPIMCCYPFLQKYFMRGLTVGAVKQ